METTDIQAARNITGTELINTADASMPPAPAAPSRKRGAPGDASSLPPARRQREEAGSNAAMLCLPCAGEGPGLEPAPRLLLQEHTRYYADGSERKSQFAVVATPHQVSRGERMGSALSRALAGKQLLITAPLDARAGDVVNFARAARGDNSSSSSSSSYHLSASDSHMHPTGYDQTGRIVNQSIIQNMDVIAMENTTLMPIPTTVLNVKPDGQKPVQEGCGVDYYIPPELRGISFDDFTPDQHEQIKAYGSQLSMETGVDATLAFQIAHSGLNQAQRSRLDPMITGLHLGNITAAKNLLCKLYENKGVFTGVGEATLAKELVSDLFEGKGQANLDTNIQAFIHLAQVAGVVGMPLVMHCDVDRLSNQLQHRSGGSAERAPAVPANLDALKNLFSDVRLHDTTIIWAHAGGLGRFIAESAGHIGELEGMLERHPNLMIDISWTRVSSQLVLANQNGANWSAFLAKHHERVFFGSDVLNPTSPDMWNENRVILASLLNMLPIDKQANILHNNYERTFVEARARVRLFEERVLTDDFYDTVLKSGVNLNLADIQAMLGQGPAA